MKIARSALLVALAATATLLSACGDDTTGVAAPASSSAAATEPSAPSSSAATSAAPTATGDVTKPGAALKVGDRAVVPFKYGTDKSGTIAITVTAIEKGENADLAKYGDKAKGIAPFYLRATVENVDGSDLAYSSVSLRALGSDGRSTGVIISGDTDKCESESAPKDFKTVGAKYDTCVLQAAREGSTVTAATFDKGDGYDKSPITWKS